MKSWLWAYFLVLSSMHKIDFQILILKGRGSPYGPVFKINPVLVVHVNISHLRTYVNENLAQCLFLGRL